MNIFPFISNARTNVDPLSSHDAIDLYPEALGKADVLGCLPLHTLFRKCILIDRGCADDDGEISSSIAM